MSESFHFITLDIELPSGEHQEVTAPSDANIQQFANALVTRLELPVISANDATIQYAFFDLDNNNFINGLISVAETDLIDGSRLRLTPRNAAGDIITLAATPDKPAPPPPPLPGRDKYGRRSEEEYKRMRRARFERMVKYVPPDYPEDYRTGMIGGFAIGTVLLIVAIVILIITREAQGEVFLIGIIALILLTVGYANYREWQIIKEREDE